MKRSGWSGASEYGRYLAGYNANMDVSFCIVNLNAKKHLNDCIASIPRSLKKLSFLLVLLKVFLKNFYIIPRMYYELEVWY